MLIKGESLTLPITLLKNINMKKILALQFPYTKHFKHDSFRTERRAVGMICFSCCDQGKNHWAKIMKNTLRASMGYVSVSVIKKEWCPTIFLQLPKLLKISLHFWGGYLNFWRLECELFQAGVACCLLFMPQLLYCEFRQNTNSPWNLPQTSRFRLRDTHHLLQDTLKKHLRGVSLCSVYTYRDRLSGNICSSLYKDTSQR